MAFQNIRVECRGCGASVSLDPTIRFGTCPYCGNCNSLIPAQEAPEIPAVEQIYPANYPEEAFRRAVRSFLCTSQDVPDELYESLLEREFTLNFWPFYRHTVQWTANWTADIGYPDENAKEGVRWSPGEGQAMGKTVVYAPASSVICNRGLGFDACRLSASNEEKSVYFQPELLQGIAYLGCDVAPEAVEEDFVVPVLEDRIEDDCIDQLPGDYQKNLHCNSRIDSRETVLELIPYWLFAYEYKGAAYYVMQNASSGTVAGSLPGSSRRKWIAWALTGTAFLLIGLCSWALYGFRNVYDAVMFASLCLPLLSSGFLYRDIMARQKARIRVSPVSSMGEHLAKLKLFENRFIRYTGLVVLGWCCAALALTLMLAVLLPFWRDPVFPGAPPEPEYPGTGTAVQKKSPVILLKLQKVPEITHTFVSEDGEEFLIGQ